MIGPFEAEGEQASQAALQVDVFLRIVILVPVLDGVWAQQLCVGSHHFADVRRSGGDIQHFPNPGCT